MLSIAFPYCYAECRYAECRYAEYRGAQRPTLRAQSRQWPHRVKVLPCSQILD